METCYLQDTNVANRLVKRHDVHKVEAWGSAFANTKRCKIYIQCTYQLVKAQLGTLLSAWKSRGIHIRSLVRISWSSEHHGLVSKDGSSQN